MTISYHGGNIIRGTAADRTGGTWTNLQSGYLFIESDTQLIYYWNGTAWAPSSVYEGPFSYIVYKAGSTIKSMDVTTKAILSSGTVADVVIQATIDILGNDSGKSIFIKNGLYTLTASLNFNAINGHCSIIGEHDSDTQLRPSGDFAAFDINGKSKITLEKLYLTHNQAGYTSNLLRLRNAIGSCKFNHVSFYDFDNHVGNAIGFDTTSGSIFRNNFNDCYIYGFNNSIYASVPNSSFFCNGNYFIGCWFWMPIRALSLNLASGGGFHNNNFMICQVQAKTSAPNQTLVAFDYETNNSGAVQYTTHDGCIAWDLGSGINYANVNTTAELTLNGCYESWKIGGIGAALGKVRTFDITTINRKDVGITNSNSPYTVLTAESVVRADATSGAITINLPSAIGIAGKEHHIFRTDILSSTNLITIDASGTQTIDSNLTYILYPGEWVKLESDGANWQVLSRSTPTPQGYYYLKGTTANRRYVAGTSFAPAALATSTTSPAANLLYAMPLIVSKTTKFDVITFTISSVSTAGNSRAGIYRDTGNCFPGALIFDTGSIVTTSTGGKDTTITAGLQVFQPGLYWLAYEQDTATGQMRIIPNIAQGLGFAGHDMGATNAGFHYTVAHTFGALPDPYTITATLTSVTPGVGVPVPAVGLRSI